MNQLASRGSSVELGSSTASQGWRKWAIAITASLGAILEVIDTSIVNVALTDMQGNLGATITEIGWVVSGYAIAVLTTLLTQREAYHRAILAEKLSPYNSLTNERMDLLTGAFQSRGMDAVTAHEQALMVMNQTINLQSAILSFEDIFRVVGIAFICSLPLLLFLGKGAKEPALQKLTRKLQRLYSLFTFGDRLL